MKAIEVDKDAEGVETVWEREIGVPITEGQPRALVRETDVDPYVWRLIKRGLRCGNNGRCQE